MLTAMQLMEIEKLEAEAIAPLQAELSELADQASELHARMGEAMQKNNMKAYQQYDTEHRAISARMDYLQNKIQHPDPLYTKESVLSAWADYAADYNADIWPLIAEYHKARKALAEQYKAIVKKQSEAQGVQAKLSTLLNRLYGSPFNFSPAAGMKELETLPHGNKLQCTPIGMRQPVTVDVAYFTLNGDLSVSNICDYSGVVDRAENCDVDHVVTAQERYTRTILGF